MNHHTMTEILLYDSDLFICSWAWPICTRLKNIRFVVFDESEARSICSFWLSVQDMFYLSDQSSSSLSAIWSVVEYSGLDISHLIVVHILTGICVMASRLSTLLVSIQLFSMIMLTFIFSRLNFYFRSPTFSLRLYTSRFSYVMFLS